MDIIHLLPDSVANQIAAGEVIQRPASVIKELVENAVDAEATRIDVIVRDAGRTSIQVADNGKGMSETDARLAFERHATSKIRQAADLFALTTMGFRGEALPSIAAVTQVELTTRTASDELGTHIRIEGSKVLSQEPVACSVGANFLVKNLFFNTPARRKFLKSNQTELSNITSEIERIVLVHPDIAFTLTSNDTPLMNLTPCSQKQRIANVFGQRLADQLLDVAVDTSMVRIHGFVGRPESSRKRGARQFFFVNNRYMRHAYFHKAIQESFASLIPVDEQVPYFIYFDVEPSEIDVNIHPTKTEIKFENEQAIWQILVAAVRESLGRFNAIPTIEFDTVGRPDIPVFTPSLTGKSQPPHVAVNPSYNPFTSGQSHPSGHAEAKPQYGADWQANMPNRPSAKGWETLFNPSDSPSSQSGFQPETTGDNTLGLNAADYSAEHFQFKGQYIMTAAHSGLMIIDQHRAHVRILHDRYLARLSQQTLPSQQLLFPEQLQLSVSDSAVLEHIAPELKRLGFAFSHSTNEIWTITGMPSGLEGVLPNRLFSDLIASGAESEGVATDQLLSRLALVVARAAAIPMGQVLSAIEMQDLVDKLFGTTNPNLTPDGKPIIVIISQDIIDKQFK